MSEENFDWGHLGQAWWEEAAATAGATPLQTRFAAARHRGMSATGAAKVSGYSGDDDSIRQAGSRAAKSTAVMNLLAMARAESGGGDDGTVGSMEAKRILSRLARGSDPNVRIKALDSLTKLEREERAVNASGQEPDQIEAARDLICAIPEGGTGATLAMAFFFNEHKNIINFPFLRECAPIVATTAAVGWAWWRDRHGQDWHSFIDKMAAGPVLEGDALVAAVNASRPKSVPTKFGEVTDAAE